MKATPLVFDTFVGLKRDTGRGGLAKDCDFLFSVLEGILLLYVNLSGGGMKKVLDYALSDSG